MLIELSGTREGQPGNSPKSTLHYKDSESTMHSSTAYIQAATALITDRERFFIARRPPGKKFGLLWEFPDGKIEPGETDEAALVRKIREELCWSISVEGSFQHMRCSRDDVNIDLYAFWRTVKSGQRRLRDQVEISSNHSATTDSRDEWNSTIRRGVNSINMGW